MITKKVMDKVGKIKAEHIAFMLFFASFIFIALTFSVDAFAASSTNTHPDGTCTFDPQFEIPYTVLSPGSGIISAIVDDVKSLLFSTTTALYFNFIMNDDFRRIIAIAISIYIAIYGVMFTFGMVQSTVYDFFIRMLKIGVIYIFVLGVYGSMWDYPLLTLQKFFIDGTDDIIAQVVKITVGGVSSAYDANKPFAILDNVIATAVSAKMAVTILATIFTGPYGLLFGLLILLSLGSLLRALFTAIWVYLMALVIKALLIALSPIFISCILFTRTRPLFDGWINQLVNACLQPIFLFIFFAFFVALIQASMNNILANPVCWTEWIDSVRGTPFAMHYWRFAIKNAAGQWEPYGGLWSWSGAPGKNTPIFPIDIMGILIFLVLAELAGRFNNIVIMIASDIAASSVNFASMQGPLSGWLSNSGGSNNSLTSGIGARKGPGGVTAPSQSFSDWKKDASAEGPLGAAGKYAARTGERGGPG